ncbi:MAG: dTDP-4-dehydrorhamnose 3,5-epimerase [Anaerolineae bacterium]|jgi:dTDP-4-dehydrorhamnose 3,5-epimerase|nr:dTDP-4-dehydrorhamnose 3,5-epimerase [Anaerolineae bacterium]
MPFTFERLSIPDVVLIKPRVFGDARGFNLETYKHSDFAAQGVPERFVQVNHSHSAAGVLRGLHYQKLPRAQGKLVGVICGSIFDVAVDIRVGSPTYGVWVAAMLSGDNHHLLYIPPGFAHGFCVVDGPADVIYQMTEEYSPEHDRGVRWNDPYIGVDWPIEIPELSVKDAKQPLLEEADNNFVYG